MIYADKSDEGDVIVIPELDVSTASNSLDDTKCIGYPQSNQCGDCARFKPVIEDNIVYFVSAPRTSVVGIKGICEMWKSK